MNEALGNLLEHPGIWRARERDENVPPGMPTGYPKLDRQLPGGGWPRHALTEILVEHHGRGELQLLMPALARLSRSPGGPRERAGWLAWIAPPFQPYPPALLQWGLDLARVLLVRPRRETDALWAAEQALASGNCAAVLLWPERLSDASGRRLQLAAEKGRSWAIAFRPARARVSASAAALRLLLTAGERGTDVGILKSRGGRPAIVRDYAE